MAPKENESTLFTSILKEMENVQNHIWSSLGHRENEVGESDAQCLDNNNSNENSDEGLWMKTSELMEKMEEEMKILSKGKDIQFLERDDSSEQVRLQFKLVGGLTAQEIKISITPSNILELEYNHDSEEEGQRCIWAYPLEQGLKPDQMSHNVTEDGQQLIVTVPKDPDFQPEEEQEECNEEESSQEAGSMLA